MHQVCLSADQCQVAFDARCMLETNLAGGQAVKMQLPRTM